MNPNGIYDPNVGEGGTGVIGSARQILPRNIYRWDPSGRLDVVVPEEPGLPPNGICFSPDYKLVYLVRGGQLWVGDVQAAKVGNLRVYTDCMVDGVHCGPDGMRADRAGNIWAGSTSILGYSGVTVWNPAGRLIGRIRLPEVCPNSALPAPSGTGSSCAAPSPSTAAGEHPGSLAWLMGRKGRIKPDRRRVIGGLAGAGFVQAAAPALARPARDVDRFLREKIGHVVVIYAENRSFNNLFSNFPGLAHRSRRSRRNGWCSATGRHGSERAAADLGRAGADTANVGRDDPSDRAGSRSAALPTARSPCGQPMALCLPHGLVTRDLVHAFYHNQMQINGGRNDGFVAWGDSGALVMGHYGDTAAEMRLAHLAREFALCDNFFMGAFGGSFLNHQYLVAAQPPFYPNADTSPAGRLIATAGGRRSEGHAA